MVVNYEINLDLCMGDWESVGKKFKVRIKGSVNGQPLKYDGTNNNVEIEKEITITSGTQKYYLTNLPKYDGNGKIIDWEIEEIELAGETILTDNSSTEQKRYCIIDGNECVVTMTDPMYNFGEHLHNDDLISVKITNRFEGETKANVHKMWYDDNNALGLRSDTYLQLWYHSTDPNNQTWTQLGGDYVWNATDLTDWSYTFNELPKFDKNGYPYVYAIKELPISDYYTSMYENTIGYNNGTTNDFAAEYDDLDGNFVPSDGWFVDRISGEVVIDGKKLWQNISTALNESHYPIANIELYRRDKYKTVNDIQVETTDTDSDKEKIGQTSIYNGDRRFIFKENEIDTDKYVKNSDNTPKF